MKVALVGLGMAVTPHAKSLVDLQGRAQVAYAFSPSQDRRRKFAERFPFPPCDRLETILEDRGVQAVAVLTPPNTHLEIVERCAAAGKHVLLEKPLEISSARAERMVAACKNVTLGVVLQNRHKPATKRLVQALAGGELGRLVAASAYIELWRPQSYYDQPGRGTKARDGGGVLLTQGIHTLDVLIGLAGEPVEAKSFFTTTPVHRMETEDLVCAALRWKGGALGVVYATTSNYPGVAERIEVVGEHGAATLAGTLARRPHRARRRRRHRRRRGRRPDGVPARLSPRGVERLPGRDRAGVVDAARAAGERRRGAQGSPPDRPAAALGRRAGGARALGEAHGIQ